jgi:hypothetical protein
MSAFSVVSSPNKRPREETLIPITLLHVNGKEILVFFVEESHFTSINVYSKSDAPAESYTLEEHIGMSYQFLNLRPRPPRFMDSLHLHKDFISQKDAEITRLRNSNANELKGKGGAKERKANYSKIRILEEEKLSRSRKIRELLCSDRVLQICEAADIERLCDDFTMLVSTHGVSPGLNGGLALSKRSLFLYVTDETFSAMRVGHSAATLEPAEGSVPVVLLFLYDGVVEGDVSVLYVPHTVLPAPLRSVCQEDVDGKKFFNRRYCNTDVEDKDYDFQGYAPLDNWLDDPNDAFRKQSAMLRDLEGEDSSAFPAYPFYLCGVYFLETSC